MQALDTACVPPPHLSLRDSFPTNGGKPFGWLLSKKARRFAGLLLFWCLHDGRLGEEVALREAGESEP